MVAVCDGRRINDCPRCDRARYHETVGSYGLDGCTADRTDRFHPGQSIHVAAYHVRIMDIRMGDHCNLVADQAVQRLRRQECPKSR